MAASSLSHLLHANNLTDNTSPPSFPSMSTDPTTTTTTTTTISSTTTGALAGHHHLPKIDISRPDPYQHQQHPQHPRHQRPQHQQQQQQQHHQRHHLQQQQQQLQQQLQQPPPHHHHHPAPVHHHHQVQPQPQQQHQQQLSSYPEPSPVDGRPPQLLGLGATDHPNPFSSSPIPGSVSAVASIGLPPTSIPTSNTLGVNTSTIAVASAPPAPVPTIAPASAAVHLTPSPSLHNPPTVSVPQASPLTLPAPSPSPLLATTTSTTAKPVTTTTTTPIFTGTTTAVTAATTPTSSHPLPPAPPTPTPAAPTPPTPTARSHASNASLYQCADCQRRYSRPEHLARHIQTHTLGKRFGCQICGKLFARADLLKRHTLNHQSDNDSKKRRKTDPGAGRVSHACRPCATARVKCEEVKPCSRCRSRNINCEYSISEAGSAAAMHLLHMSKGSSTVGQDDNSNSGHNSPPTPAIKPEDQSQPPQAQQPQLQPQTRTQAQNRDQAQAKVQAQHLALATAQDQPRTQPWTQHPPQPAPFVHDQQHEPQQHLQQPRQPPSPSAGPHQGTPSHPHQPEQATAPSTAPIHQALHPQQPVILQPSPVPANPLSVHDSSPVSTRHHPLNPEESQLPTPDTVMEQNTDYNPPFLNDNVVDVSRLPFTDFLRDILYQPTLDAARIEDAQGLAILDFCNNANLEMNDIDFGLLDNWNLEGFAPSAAQMHTPNADDALDLDQMRQKVVKIWSVSPWRWDPNKQDTGYQEQGNLAVPSASQLNSVQLLDRVTNEKLEPSGRDKMLATVLSTVKASAIMQQVASSFPSVEVYDTLIHAFLTSHTCSVSEFIHFGSFKMNQQWPEWLTIVASAGAILTPVQTLKKLGYALQEAVRLTIHTRFEEKNSNIQNLGAVQAFVMVQDVGLWSGNKRKMEIAECHLLIPITMMRYRGKFQRAKYQVVTVDLSDEGEVLEEKWRTWHEQESWKRLVFHAYIRDAEASMTTFTNMSMSYSELSLPLPEARDVWFARTAQEWKMHYLQRSAGYQKRPPSLCDLMRDISLLAQNYNRLDVQYSISIFLHGFWLLILEYRQLNAVLRGSRAASNPLSATSSVVLTSRHQELCKELQNFQAMTADWDNNGSMSAQESIVLHLLLMNLHVSLDELQLFSGKEGEDQARRIYPVLQQWAAAPEARHALWHAGQIMRQAKMFPPGHLKDFYAVAVHHAGLALWTYGVVTKAAKQHSAASMPGMPRQFEETVQLDGTNVDAASRFAGMNPGRPVIRSVMVDQASGVCTEGAEGSIEDPKACMDVVQEVLRANFGGGDLPAIVENLCHLLKQLGGAAWAVGLG